MRGGHGLANLLHAQRLEHRIHRIGKEAGLELSEQFSRNGRDVFDTRHRQQNSFGAGVEGDRRGSSRTKFPGRLSASYACRYSISAGAALEVRKLQPDEVDGEVYALFHFHDDQVRRAAAEVGAAVLEVAIGPEDVTGGAVHGCELAVGGFEARGEIGEQDHGASGASVFVPLLAVSGIEDGSVDAHLGVLEDELIVGGIAPQGVEVTCAPGRNRRGGQLDFDFDDAERGVTDDLAGMHAIGGAPGHVAGLPVEVLGLGAGVGDILIGVIEVDHHAIEIVFVEERGLVGMIDHGEDSDARIVHVHGGLGGQREREQGEEKRWHGSAFRRFLAAAHNACGGLTHAESISKSAVQASGECLTVLGDNSWRIVSRGANPGTDSQFPANCA